MPSTATHVLTVTPEHVGKRLDQALADLLPEYSRTRLKDWIEAGQVLVDGLPLRPRARVVGGEQIAVTATVQPDLTVGPEAIALEVVHQDEAIFVINKPAGLVVHPGAGNSTGTLQNALLHRDPKLAQLPRAGIVHRLDKDTSGLLVIARTLEAHTALVRQLEAHEVSREYEAVCVGVVTAGGTVDAAIGRHPTERVRMSIRDDGREAVTHYRVLQRFRAHTHLRVQLETGRTHQIRVHMAHLGHPLVGDSVYGRRLMMPKAATPELATALRAFHRQALHAARLAFAHPLTGEPIVCEAPVPTDMRELLQALASDAAQIGPNRR